MSLDEFKVIYWWEWGHRFLGRIIGIAFLLPFLYFIFIERIGQTLTIKLGGIFVLGAMQGALGWYMVQSGLTERVDVSQYRLAAHLGLAVALYAAMLWLALELISSKPFPAIPPRVRMAAGLLTMGVFLQILLGAFVAGLRAGKTFNSWPLMDGRFFPEGYFGASARFADLFETIAAVQFNHRIGAYAVAALSVWLFVVARGSAIESRVKLLLGIMAVQIALGIWTVLASTPIALGLAHQAGALALLSAAIYALHGSMTSIEMTEASS